MLSNGYWRIRSRSRWLTLDTSLGTSHLPTARQRARRILQEFRAGALTPARRTGTLEQLADLYLSTPKRAAQDVAAANVSRLRTVIRAVTGRELDQCDAAEVTAHTWTAYQRHMLGASFNYSTRRRENIAINSAIRAARCLFIRRLRPAYEAAGIVLAPDCDVVTWLPEPYVAPAPVDDAALLTAWRRIEGSPLWITIGLARFAGLRRDEIAAAQRHWIVERDGALQVELRDRPEDGWQNKTGQRYFSPILDATLAAALLGAPPGLLVRPSCPDRRTWFEREPQRWMRQFTAARQPLHRLRGLYADDVRRLSEASILARLQAVKAAADALGHTSPSTTVRHYLSE